MRNLRRITNVSINIRINRKDLGLKILYTRLSGKVNVLSLELLTPYDRLKTHGVSHAALFLLTKYSTFYTMLIQGKWQIS